MSIETNVYGNDGEGDPPDYTTPLATVAGYTWDTPELALGSVNTFAVRNVDTVTDLVETNTDARITIMVSAAGVDVTGQPNAPTGLSVTLTAGGSIQVAWQYNPLGQGGAPTGFHVYVGTPTPNYATPATVGHDPNNNPITSVPYETGAIGFTATLSGLAALGTSYTGQVGVRAYNGTAEEQNTNVVGFTADQIVPSAVDHLTVTAVP